MLRSRCGYVTIKLFILMALCCLIQADCNRLTVYHGKKLIDSNSVFVRKYTTRECGAFVTSFNQSDLPEDFPTNEVSVERPSNISLRSEDFYDISVDTNVRTRLIVSWNSPHSGNARKNCFGYLIIWRSTNSNFDCTLFKLNSTNKILEKKLQFSCNIENVIDSTSYTVRIYSMPPSSHKQRDAEHAFDYMKFQMPPKRERIVAPANWSPYLAIKTFHNGTVILTFTLPPPLLNLTRFSIRLVNTLNSEKLLYMSDYRPQAYSNQNQQGIQRFTINDTGCYKVAVYVEEEEGFHNVEGKCSCWMLLDDEYRVCQNACGSTLTRFCLNVTDLLVEPAKWTPFIKHKSFENGTIIVEFILPPPSFNLTRFSVLLANNLNIEKPIHSVDYRPQAYSEQNQLGIQTFTVNVTGCFQVAVWVKEEEGFQNVEGKCSCWKYVDGKRSCESKCGANHTNFCLNVTVLPSILSDNQHIIKTVAGGIIGSLIVVVLGILVACHLRKSDTAKRWVQKWWCMLPSHEAKLEHPVDADGLTDVSDLPTLSQKIVYIMFADEHQPHLQLIESLSDFLEVHCHCKVIRPSQCSDYDLGVYKWFISNISMSDYMIFVNSEGAENMILAHLENKKSYSSRRPDLDRDLFEYGLKHLMSNDEVRDRNVILVSFKGKHCQKYLQTSEIHMLPEHLPHLLLKIHNLNAKKARAYDNLLPLQIQNIPNLTEGARLISAIQAVHDYEELNPLKFDKSYGRLKLLSNDSGFKSSIGSVSMQDLTISETTSPVSVFEKPDFTKCLDAITMLNSLGPPALDYSSMSHSQLNNGGHGAESDILDSGFSCFSIPSTQCSEPLRELNDEGKQETVDELSIVPPESVAGLACESCSEAFAQINRDAESVCQ